MPTTCANGSAGSEESGAACSSSSATTTCDRQGEPAGRSGTVRSVTSSHGSMWSSRRTPRRSATHASSTPSGPPEEREPARLEPLRRAPVSQSQRREWPPLLDGAAHAAHAAPSLAGHGPGRAAPAPQRRPGRRGGHVHRSCDVSHPGRHHRSEEHTSELQSLTNLVCRLLLEKKNTTSTVQPTTE